MSHSFLRFIPDTDKLFIKFHKIYSDIKNHNASLEDAVKVY